MNNDFVNKWTSQLKKGTLSFVVLMILKDKKEYYGYELINKIKDKVAIDIAEGTLYPLMNRLKEQNIVEYKWVEQESGIPRKYYNITKAGSNAVEEMERYWKTINQKISSL